MEERRITLDTYIAGTLAGNHTVIDEFPFGVTFSAAKAWASNDSDATLACADPSATIITAATIGDSGDPKTLTADAGVAPRHVAADTAITWTLDYDGASGTAAQNFRLIRVYLTD